MVNPEELHHNYGYVDPLTASTATITNVERPPTPPIETFRRNRTSLLNVAQRAGWWGNASGERENLRRLFDNVVKSNEQSAYCWFFGRCARELRAREETEGPVRRDVFWGVVGTVLRRRGLGLRGCGDSGRRWGCGVGGE